MTERFTRIPILQTRAGFCSRSSSIATWGVSPVRRWFSMSSRDVASRSVAKEAAGRGASVGVGGIVASSSHSVASRLYERIEEVSATFSVGGNPKSRKKCAALEVWMCKKVYGVDVQSTLDEPKTFLTGHRSYTRTNLIGIRG